MLVENDRFSFLVGDAFSPPRLGISSCKSKLDAVVDLCDCVFLTRFASRFCQNGESAAFIDIRHSPMA